MTTITRKVRKYMTLVEDMAILYSNAAEREMLNESAWRIKGFARHTVGERDAMTKIGQLLNRKQEAEEGLRTMREDFPQLFEDEKVSIK